MGLEMSMLDNQVTSIFVIIIVIINTGRLCGRDIFSCYMQINYHRSVIHHSSFGTCIIQAGGGDLIFDHHIVGESFNDLQLALDRHITIILCCYFSQSCNVVVTHVILFGISI